MTEIDFKQEITELLQFTSNVAIAIRFITGYGQQRKLSEAEANDLSCLSSSLHNFTLVGRAISASGDDALQSLKMQLSIFESYTIDPAYIAAFKRAERFNVNLSLATKALKSMYQKTATAIKNTQIQLIENTLEA